MALTSPPQSPCSPPLLPKPSFLSSRGASRSPGGRFRLKACSSSSSSSSSSSDVPVPDFLPSQWLESKRKRPFGPRLCFSAEDAVQHQLDALKYNDQPRPDYGIEVMYRFAGFDPFERSIYFGRFFDLGQFERFRRIFHHSTYRVLLGHREREILSSLLVEEAQFHQLCCACRLVHFANILLRICNPCGIESFQPASVGAWCSSR